MDKTTTLSPQERADHILQLETPKWEIVLHEYKRLKGDHRLTDAHISSWFGYANVNSFRNSARYRDVVTGCVRLWLSTQ